MYPVLIENYLRNLRNAIYVVKINFVVVFKQLLLPSCVAVVLQVGSSPASLAVYLGPGR